MSNYSLKERMIARILSNTPRIKRTVKLIYVKFNALIYKKKYTNLIIESSIKSINSVVDLKQNEESFFGYYDSFPMNEEGWVISNISTHSTINPPSTNKSIKINLTNIYTNESILVGETFSYNWQQGARAQWLDNERLIFNIYDSKKNEYGSKVFSLKSRKITQSIELPVQDSFKDYFLSINYERLMVSSPDYGYKNKPLLTKSKLRDYNKDGILMFNFKNNKSKILHTFNDIFNVGFKPEFDNAIHTINHIMISPSGRGFIFIHRYYINNVRYDRLLFSDFVNIKVLVDGKMVSHCCWLDENNVFGYLRYQEQDGYYKYDLESGVVTKNNVMTDLEIGDGHPYSDLNTIIFDSYPNKSRIQKLIKYNSLDNSVAELLELFQHSDYKDETRCDLHPRYNAKKDIVFFDSVFDGKRKHYYVKIN